MLAKRMSPRSKLNPWRLFSGIPRAPDVATIDICVVGAIWPGKVRKQVTEYLLAAMTHGLWD